MIYVSKPARGEKGIHCLLTPGEGSGDAVGNRQTGRATTDDDKVILVPELRHLPLGQDLVAAGQGLDGAEEQRADGESVGETHLSFFKYGNNEGNVGGYMERVNTRLLKRTLLLRERSRRQGEEVRSEKKGSSSFL